MATEIGIVKALIGTATATAADGTVRNLQIGDQIFADELVSTGATGAIEIEFADGSVMDLGRDSQALLDNAVFNPDGVAEAAVTTDSDADAIQAAILAGADPTQVTEATAAGAGTQADGNEGHAPVVIDYLAPQVTPESGFDTTGISVAFPVIEEELLAPIDAPAVVNISPVADPVLTEANRGELPAGLQSALLELGLGGSSGGGTTSGVSPSPTNNLLINGLGGPRGFGENTLDANDDGSSVAIDITSVFGPQGLNFFGTFYTSIFINNNGNITFQNALSTYTPSGITGATAPMIAPYFADVDTRGGSIPSYDTDGNSTGSNLVYWDLDTVNGVLTITWDDVGYYSSHTDLSNAFQLIIYDNGDGDFGFEFRYEDINWTTGSASGGTDGLGGTIATAGWSAGDGVNFFALPQSSDQAQMLALEDAGTNVGIDGVWQFGVVGGGVVNPTTIDVALYKELTVDGIIGDSDIASADFGGSDTETSLENLVFTLNSDPTYGSLILVTSAGTTSLMSVGDTFTSADTVWWFATKEDLAQFEGTPPSVTFDYLVTDEAGVSASATVTIQIPDDNPEVFVQTPITVDEDGLEGGIAGGTGDVAGELTIINGTLNYDFGIDGTGDINFASLNGEIVQATGDLGLQNLTSQGNSITYVWDGSTHTLTGVANVGDEGAYDVFTLVVNDINTGDYTFTLLAQVDHPTTDTEDDLVLNLPFTVTDSDGDSANGSLQVTIDDDGPVVDITVSEAGAVVTDETDQLGVPVIGGASVFSYVVAATAGADGGSTAVTLSIDNAATGLTVTDGGYVITLVAGSSDSEVIGQYNDGVDDLAAFVISIDSNGVLTVTQNVAMVHPTSPDSYDEAVNLTGELSAVVTVTDGDGDIATDSVAIGGLISFEDDGPVVDVGLAQQSDGGEGGGEQIFINFDALSIGTDVSTYYPGVTFSGINGGTLTVDIPYAESSPNSVWFHGNANEPLIVEFAEPINNLTFYVGADNTRPETFNVDIYIDGIYSETKQFVSDGNTDTTDLVDLSEFSNVTKIVVKDITDGGGYTYDSFSYTTGSVGVSLPTLTTQDADTIDEASDTDSASFASLFTLDFNGGADGAEAPTLSYALSLGAAASNTGLFSEGNPILLSLNEDGDVVGSTVDGVVFTISVNPDTGFVLLT